MFAEPTDNDVALEKTIHSLFEELTDETGASQEYAQMVDQLTKLYKLKESTAPKRVSPDTLVLVAGNLAGIIMIVGHERMNVVTSKALNFVLKLR